MPGKLRHDAVCPLCQKDLLCLTDTSNSQSITREYNHTDRSPKCVKKFVGGIDRAIARRERRLLETPFLDEPIH